MLMKLFKRVASKKSSTSTKLATASKAIRFDLDTLEDRRLMASSLALGINVNSVNSGNYSTVVNMLKDTGQKSVRLWIGFDSYDSRSANGVLKFAPRLKADGFDVMVSVVPSHGQKGSYSQVKGLFEFLVNQPGLRGAVDRWQVGNEPDHARYWAYGVSSYVTDFLKPAAEVLHSYGEKVVSAGPSWNPEDIKTMVKAGLLNYADFVGYHPYRSTLSDLKDMVAQVKDAVNGKPLVASEWNVRGHEGEADKSGWADDIGSFFNVIKDNFYAAYYYAATASSTKAGAAGILKSSGARNEPFYTAVKNLKNSFNGTTPVEPPVVPPTGGGSTPSGTVTAPKVTGFTIIDAATGKALAGYSNIAASKTITLASLPTRNIQIIAVANAATGSVQVGFSGRGTHTENNAAYELIVDSKGYATAWAARAGTYTASATAYAQDGLKGTKGNSLSITLKFV